MNALIVIFSHDPTDIVSNIIAALTFGKVTHCAILGTGDMVIEATGSNKPRGVREVTLASFLKKHPHTQIRYIPLERVSPEQVYDAAKKYLGCKYDWFWMLGWVLRTPHLEHPKKFGCAELIAQAAIDCGEPLLAGDHTWHVTPYQLWQISKPLKEQNNDY